MIIFLISNHHAWNACIEKDEPTKTGVSSRVWSRGSNVCNFISFCNLEMSSPIGYDQVVVSRAIQLRHLVDIFMDYGAPLFI